MQRLTVFSGTTRIAFGPLAVVLAPVMEAQGSEHPLLVFDDATGKVVDLDLRGTPEAILDRHSRAETTAPDAARSRGRPRLGVTSREVTLLPRHWDWLATQPGGASAALRRLVDGARKSGVPETDVRAAREVTYRVMLALAGDLPGYEEALRHLFSGDAAGFEARIAGWPPDLRAYVGDLARGAFGQST